MSTAEAMLAQARALLGLSGRPNKVTREYAERHGAAFLEASWCDMGVTYEARHSGNAAAALPAGDRAYTVWHAEDGQKLGRWYPGTTANVKGHCKPGAIVFFDWDGTDQIGRIDHVGVAEVNLGDGRIQTIECNTSDACKRRVRAANVIAGFWNPAYATAAASDARAWPGVYYRLKTPMMRGENEKWIQRRLNAKGASPKLGVDGVFGPRTDREVRDYQKAHGLDVDGIVGAQTWASLAK